MGRRSEPRTAISFPVFVRGFDSRGSPFAVSTETFDVSSTGASVKGLEGLVQPGTKIEIEFKDQKSWYRVQWVGKNGSGKAGRIGVHCLERKYIWDVAPRTWDTDTYGGVSGTKAATVPWSGEERRLFGRRSCRIEAQASIPGSSMSLPGKVTDISLGGCYVEMLAPLPVGTMVELALTAGDTILRASGKVRSSQMGLGMGVAFASMSPGDFEKLRKFSLAASGTPEIATLAGQAAQRLQPTVQAGSPLAEAARSNHGSSLAAPPKHAPTTAEALEAVIRVLLRKGLLARDELTTELDRVKATKN
jgi:hypothetical protein